MENKKYSKRAVVLSIIAVLMCCTLLVGGTFAWFTDTATTGINTIESGNLDIEMYFATYDAMEDGTITDDEWMPVSTDKSVFNEDALWEPGYTEVVYFKMANVGNLSLKYRMGVEIFSELSSTNKYGEEFNLSDYICAYRMDGDKVWEFPNREHAQNPYAGWPMVNFEGTPLSVAVEGVFSGEDEISGSSLNAYNWLEPGEVGYTTLVLWMPEEVGNEANYLTGKDAPQIQLGAYITATQFNWEEEFDSFDHNYDKDAEYPTYVMNEAELNAALAAGKQAILGNNIELTAPIEITNKAVIYMQGFAIDGLDVNGAPAFVLKDGASLNISAPQKSEIDVPASGLVAFDAGANASVTLTGGNYSGNGGNFIKGAGDSKGVVTLNGVNYTNSSSAAITYFPGEEVAVNVNGGSYTSGYGFIVGNNSTISDTEITINGGAKDPAVYARDNTTITDTKITTTGFGVAVGGNDTVTVEDCEIISSNYAAYIYQSGGTVHLNNTTYTGKIPNGSESKLNAGAVMELYKDGTLVFRKAK